MKWSNHERLSAYGVRMVGWPEDIPKKNPSALNSTQNKQLLELAQTGVLGFSRLDGRSVTSLIGEDLWNNPPSDTSGARNVEKTWTNHERRLGAYGALTVSWPDNIPESPSVLNSVKSNQTDDSLAVASSMHGAGDSVDQTAEEDTQTLDFMDEYICSDGDYAAGSLADSTISVRTPDSSSLMLLMECSGIQCRPAFLAMATWLLLRKVMVIWAPESVPDMVDSLHHNVSCFDFSMPCIWIMHVA